MWNRFDKVKYFAKNNSGFINYRKYEVKPVKIKESNFVNIFLVNYLKGADIYHPNMGKIMKKWKCRSGVIGSTLVWKSKVRDSITGCGGLKSWHPDKKMDNDDRWLEEWKIYILSRGKLGSNMKLKNKSHKNHIKYTFT